MAKIANILDTFNEKHNFFKKVVLCCINGICGILVFFVDVLTDTHPVL